MGRAHRHDEEESKAHCFFFPPPPDSYLLYSLFSLVWRGSGKQGLNSTVDPTALEFDRDTYVSLKADFDEKEKKNKPNDNKRASSLSLRLARSATGPAIKPFPFLLISSLLLSQIASVCLSVPLLPPQPNSLGAVIGRRAAAKKRGAEK